ncbi:unnamed protein product [Mytilus edulis]|uniref:Anoctamin n=1 Tax=Mytilus edulis TaxID=6550 RepID=A0A8S3SBB5_MYTED|nr:unnamed protein product [Mytilus edulis]
MILHEVSKDSKFHELNRVATSPPDTANIPPENSKDNTFHKSNRVGTPRQDSKKVGEEDVEKDHRKELNDEWTGFFPIAANDENSNIFLKLWKRQTATLASQWEVEEFSATEPERPEFYGTLRADSITEQQVLYYPMLKQLKHFVVSGLTVVFMLCVVLASVIGVIVYRVFVSIDYCSSNTAEACVLVTTIASSLLNTISILVLSKLYNLLARKLTFWENHRTQTSFDNALIIKMFAFEFVNNYSSCFYIAFFQRGVYFLNRFGEEGILGLGGNYPDSCEPDGNCMSELTFQILILTICKPLPKFFTDIVLLWVRLLWIKRLKSCWNGKVGVQEEDPVQKEDPVQLTFIQIESLKPPLDDFTMEEYTEKIIQYGFLMLFAASLPIAPLIVIITNLIDMRIDAYRLLWLYRRPVAKRAQDIGIWYIILQFVNICGVISNGCLISLTSSWGRQYDDYTRLWIVVGFEHIVFSLQFMLFYLIPDVPSRVKLRSEKRKYRMSEEPKYDRNLLEDYWKKIINRHEDERKEKKPKNQVCTMCPKLPV